ncbi:MAG: DUF1826 domain-containing protein [Pseudomonadota bacterium]
MTLHQSIAAASVEGVAIGAAPQSLFAIHETDCAAAIWQRAPLTAFQDWIGALPVDQLPRARTILRPNAVRHAMSDLCDGRDLAPSIERDMLIDDVAALSEIFARVMQAHFVRLRLGVITTNACRKFHLDSMTARLICTYRGMGTQYGLSASQADPTADPRHVHTTPTGCPIMLRGSLWPVEMAQTLLHRSPPIEGTGEARLVLVLDPVSDLNAARDEDLLH